MHISTLRLSEYEAKKKTRRTEEGKNEPSTSKTFRLHKSKIDILEREATERNVSPNEIVTELIGQELGKEHALRGLKTMRVSSLMLKQITEVIPEEKVIEIGQNLANDALERNLPVEITGQLSMPSVLETMKYFSGAHSYEYSETEHEGSKVIVLAHYVGKKYSVLIATFWKTLLTSIGVNITCSVDDNAVVLKFGKLIDGDR